MKWKIAAGAILALIIAALGSMYYIAGTPQYSLYLIRKSILADDARTFFTYFDEERVVQRAIERAVGQVPAGPNVVSEAAISQAIPAGKRVLSDRILERLEQPGTIPLLDSTVDSVHYEGRMAIVTLRLPADNSTTTVVMEHLSDRRWKIVDLDLSKANVAFEYRDMS